LYSGKARNRWTNCASLGVENLGVCQRHVGTSFVGICGLPTNVPTNLPDTNSQPRTALDAKIPNTLCFAMNYG
jgi:hypothetical protein